MGLTVDSSQLMFLPISKSRDTKNYDKFQNSGQTKFRYTIPYHTIILFQADIVH